MYLYNIYLQGRYLGQGAFADPEFVEKYYASLLSGRAVDVHMLHENTLKVLTLEK